MTSDPTQALAVRLATLRAISRALSYTLDPVEVLRRVHRELQRVVDAPICLFGAYDRCAQSVRVIWQTHQGEELPGGQFPLGKGVTSQVLRTGEPQLIRHWSAQAPPIQVQYATERPELPESAMVVPVVFNDEVRGVLSVQHYEPHAFDAEDLALLQDIAHQIAPALLTALDARAGCGDAPGNPLELEALVAALPDGVLVVDKRARLVGLNRAARRLLCLDTSSLVLGHPVDQRQGERWPLGTHRVTEQVRPLIAQLKRGANPDTDVEVTLPGGHAARASCRGAVLHRDGHPAGGVLILHPVATGTPGALHSLSVMSTDGHSRGE